MSPQTRQAPSDRERPLSERELEVLVLIGEGSRNKDIARKLAVTEKTVKAHVSNIMQKLNAADRTEAVMIALRKGIITM